MRVEKTKKPDTLGLKTLDTKKSAVSVSYVTSVPGTVTKLWMGKKLMKECSLSQV